MSERIRFLSYSEALLYTQLTRSVLRAYLALYGHGIRHLRQDLLDKIVKEAARDRKWRYKPGGTRAAARRSYLNAKARRALSPPASMVETTAQDRQDL